MVDESDILVIRCLKICEELRWYRNPKYREEGYPKFLKISYLQVKISSWKDLMLVTLQTEPEIVDYESDARTRKNDIFYKWNLRLIN